jgi:CRP/FNR family transcriptional regulator, cyclic AMP receptor protein
MPRDPRQQVEPAWAPLRALMPMRSRIGDRAWEELLDGAPVAQVTAGSVIFRTGSPPRLAAITAGLVRVFICGPGGRQVPLRYARPGDLVGLGALLSGTEMLSAEAVTTTTLAMVSVDRLHAIAGRNPELSWSVAKHLAMWSAAAVASLVGAGFEQMSVRVAQHLVDLAIRAPDGQTVAYVTHRALADAVGTAREVVTRVLGEFREQGIVCTRPGRVIVLDPPRLAAIADGGLAAGTRAHAVPGTADPVTDVRGRPITVDRLLGHVPARRRPPPPAGA